MVARVEVPVTTKELVVVALAVVKLVIVPVVPKSVFAVRTEVDAVFRTV